MAQLVALLRGINVGRNRRMPMADLRALLSDAGYVDVRTLLQSGNVVLTSDDPPEVVEPALERLISERFGWEVPVITRSERELREIVAHDPLGAVATNPKHYLVVFLAEEGDPDALRALGGERWPEEHFAARGREVYTWNPDGLQNSGLMAAFGKPSAPRNTARNWNTVVKLVAMLDDAG